MVCSFSHGHHSRTSGVFEELRVIDTYTPSGGVVIKQWNLRKRGSVLVMGNQGLLCGGESIGMRRISEWTSA